MMMGKIFLFKIRCGLISDTQVSDRSERTAFRLACPSKWSWRSPVKLFLVIARMRKEGGGSPLTAACVDSACLRALVARDASSLASVESSTYLSLTDELWDRVRREALGCAGAAGDFFPFAVGFNLVGGAVLDPGCVAASAYDLDVVACFVARMAVSRASWSTLASRDLIPASTVSARGSERLSRGS